MLFLDLLRRPAVEQSPSSHSIASSQNVGCSPARNYGLAPSLSTASSASRAWSVARSDSNATTATSGLGSEISDFDASSLMLHEQDMLEGSESASSVGAEGLKPRPLKKKEQEKDSDVSDVDDDDDDDDEGVSISLRNPAGSSTGFSSGSGMPSGCVLSKSGSGTGFPIRPSSLTTTLGSFNEVKDP